MTSTSIGSDRDTSVRSGGASQVGPSSTRSLARHAGLVLWLSAAALVVALWTNVGGGNLAPALIDVRVSTVPSPTTATVRAVHVKSGDLVRAGDVLVELDDVEADLQLALARAELERVRVTVTAREVDVADKDYELGMRLTIEHEKAGLAKTTLLGDMARNEGELQSLDELIARQQSLVAQKLASASTLDELVVRRRALSQQVQEAQKQKTAAEAFEQAAAKRLVDWRVRHGDDAQRTAPDRAAVVAQQERVKATEALKERLVLRAPISGRVEGVVVGVGDAVTEGMALVAVMDTAATHATAWVAEDTAWRVQPGDQVRLRSVDGRAIGLQGHVRALGGGIVEGPGRLRVLPGEALFGRAVYIDLDPIAERTAADGNSPAPLPGQTYEANFLGAGPTSPRTP